MKHIIRNITADMFDIDCSSVCPFLQTSSRLIRSMLVSAVHTIVGFLGWVSDIQGKLWCPYHELECSRCVGNRLLHKLHGA